MQRYSPANQLGNLHTQNESAETPPSPRVAGWACGRAVPGVQSLLPSYGRDCGFLLGEAAWGHNRRCLVPLRPPSRCRISFIRVREEAAAMRPGLPGAQGSSQ